MTVDEMKDRIVEDGWCVVEEVIPSAEVEGVRESILATAATHRLADPRRKLDKVSGLINFDQSFAPYLAEPRFLGLCQALLGPPLRVSYTTCMGNASGSCARHVACGLALQSAERRACAGAVSRCDHASDDHLDADRIQC